MTTFTMSLPSDPSIARDAKAPTTTEVALELLVRALQERKEGALEALIKKTEKACYHLALSILKDPELSRDALQESYFVVYQRIGQLREAGAFKAWLFRIVTHCCTDILRKRAPEVEADLSRQGAAPSDDPARLVPDQVLLKETFHALPEIDREALALREVCHLSYDEMSQVLSIPVGTVRSRLAKARKRFIQAYRKEHARD